MTVFLNMLKDSSTGSHLLSPTNCWMSRDYNHEVHSNKMQMRQSCAMRQQDVQPHTQLTNLELAKSCCCRGTLPQPIKLLSLKLLVNHYYSQTLLLQLT